jgi:hypothetical protein
MPKGDDGAQTGFWKTTLGYVTQAGIILTAIAAIVGAIGAFGGDSPPSTSTPTSTATLTATPAVARLPDACVSQLSQTEETTGAQDPVPLAPIKVHSRPAAVAIGRGSAWVAHTDGRVTRIPLDTHRRRVNPLEGVRVGTQRNGQVSIAYGFEAVWIAKRETKPTRGYLAKLDPSGGAPHQIRLAQPDNVAVGGGFVWVTHDDGRLTRLEPNALSHRRKELVGGEPHGAWARHPPCVYVATTSPNGFVAFDTDTGERVKGGTYAVGAGQEIVGGANALWLTDKPGKAVLRIDPSRPDREHAQAIDIDVEPAVDALAAGASGIWTADGVRTVVRVDPTDLTAQPIDVGGAPVGIAIGGSPERVWVAQRDSNEVTRIRP